MVGFCNSARPGLVSIPVCSITSDGSASSVGDLVISGVVTSDEGLGFAEDLRRLRDLGVVVLALDWKVKYIGRKFKLENGKQVSTLIIIALQFFLSKANGSFRITFHSANKYKLFEEVSR